MTADLQFLSIRELGGLLRTKQVSPVELAEFFLDKLESEGPRYNALVALTRERALKQAKQAEKEIASGEYRGPLHGIPYGLKDLVATAGGTPTTWGAVPFQDQTFDYDATIVQKLDAAGAVLVAKLAMVELAGGMGYLYPSASATGPAITPWGNKDSWTGGSSSGSGTAVAAGLVPFAIGSETWGSILLPAHNCGIAGLRPTYGRVSRYGAMALSWTLDKLGPMCLTADDCGLVLEAIAGHDPNDSTTSDRPYSYDAEHAASRRFKLGVLKGMVDAAEEEVKANFQQSLKVLEQMADIEEVEFPDMPYEPVTRTNLNAESASINGAHVELAGDVALLGGAAGPAQCLRIVHHDAVAVDIKTAERRLRAGVACLGERSPRLERGGDITPLVRGLSLFPITDGVPAVGGHNHERQRESDREQRPARSATCSAAHSHSIVPGGFEVTS